jgi:hypothetical protein
MPGLPGSNKDRPLTGDEYVDAMNQVSLACRLLLNLDGLDDCLLSDRPA